MASMWDGGGGGSSTAKKNVGVFGASGIANNMGLMSNQIPSTVMFPYTGSDPNAIAPVNNYAKVPPASLGGGAGAYGAGGSGSGAYGAGGSGYGDAGFNLASDGGGGGAGVGPVVANDLASPFTGFAARYMPASAEMLFSNPEVILRDTLRDMGRLPDQGLYYMMEPMAQNANALFALGYGGSSDLGAGSNEAGINFINDYLRNQGTVGGNAVNFNQGMQALANYAPGSALDSMLNLASPEDQISNYRGIASALANTSLHPLMSRAFNSFLDARGTDYLSSVARGGAQSNFGNYLASRQGPMQLQPGV